MATFRGTAGLNYAKIRHPKRDNKSVIDLTKELAKNEIKNDSNQSQEKNPVFEDGMNKDNLNYINNLLKETELAKTSTRNKSISLKSNIAVQNSLQKKKAQLVSKFERLKEEKAEIEKSPIINEKMVSLNERSPIISEKILSFNLNDRSLISKKSSLENSQIQKDLKNSDVTGNQKLFDQFFKMKSSNANDEFIRGKITNEELMSPSMTNLNNLNSLSNLNNLNSPVQQHIQHTYSTLSKSEEKKFNQTLSTNTQLSTKISNKNENDFLKSIDEYLVHLDTNEKELGTAYFSIESEKKNNELESLRNENKSLKLKVEKYELKIKDNHNNRRGMMQEMNHLKIKEEENHNLMKCLQQEIVKFKSFIENLKFKLKITQESLAKEKIEAENSMIALKKVLYNNMNESRMEDKFKKMFFKGKDKKEMEKTADFENNFFLNNFDVNLKNTDNKMFANQNITIEESNESFIGRSMESNIKSSYSQESFDDFTLYKLDNKQKKALYDLQRKRKSMHSRYDYNSNSNYNLGPINEQSFLRKINKNEFKENFFPQTMKYPQLKKSHNNKEFKLEEESSVNDVQLNSLSMQME